MTGSPFFRLAILFFVAPAALAQLPSTPVQAISLTPAIVVAGSPEILRVDVPDAKSIDGEWLDRKLQLFPSHDRRAWFALAGVDVEAAVGPSSLLLHLHLAGGATRDIAQTIEIHPAHYRTGVLTVSPKFVEPGPDELKQIAA